MLIKFLWFPLCISLSRYFWHEHYSTKSKNIPLKCNTRQNNVINCQSKINSLERKRQWNQGIDQNKLSMIGINILINNNNYCYEIYDPVNINNAIETTLLHRKIYVSCTILCHIIYYDYHYFSVCFPFPFVRQNCCCCRTDLF